MTIAKPVRYALNREPESPWVAVEDRLPDTARFVWATIDAIGYRLTKEAYYDLKDGWLVFSGYACLGHITLPPEQRVTAWCDIVACPPPYQPDKAHGEDGGGA